MNRTGGDDGEPAELMPVLEVLHHAAITPARPGDQLVSASVGPAGEFISLWAAPQDVPALTAKTTGPGGVIFSETRSPRPVSARVSVLTAERGSIVSLAGLRLAHVHVQPLPGGRILLVGARARWRPEGADRNAVVYDADGQVVTEQVLGDGIAHVVTSSSGHVWVGYFDEGVYGNFGWGHADSAPPLGACGLARFSPDLQPDWRFPSSVYNEWGAISECYALNVAGDVAWTCYYTDFPIVRIRDGVLTGWRNDVAGARALAVDDSRIALYGGYGPHRDRLVVGNLDGECLQVTGEYRLTLPAGRPQPTARRVIGRGPDLHLITDDDWYRLNLTDIPR